MSIAHLLEDFAARPVGLEAPARAVDPQELETRRLAAFQEGYRAGGEDARQAQIKDRRHLSSELTQNLLDLSFTYTEAHTHLFRELRPLLVEIVDKLLPRLMRASIGPRIIEELQAAAGESLRGEAHILVNPALVGTVETLVGPGLGFPVTVRGDAGLGEGQAQLSLPSREVEINLDALIAEIATALEAFTHDLQEDRPDARRQAV